MTRIFKYIIIIAITLISKNLNSQEYKSILLDYDFNPNVDNLIIYKDSVFFNSIGFFSSTGGTVITSLDLNLNAFRDTYFEGLFAAKHAFIVKEDSLLMYANSRIKLDEDMLLNFDIVLDTIAVYKTNFTTNLGVHSTRLNSFNYLSWYDTHPDGDRSFGIRKVNDEGSISWQSNFHIDSSYSQIWDLGISYDDHLLVSNDIVLHTLENGNEFYGQVKKLDQDGNLIWEYTTDYFLRNSAGQPLIELSNNEIIINHQPFGKNELSGTGLNARPEQITWISADGNYLKDYFFKVKTSETLEVFDLVKGSGDYFFVLGEIYDSPEIGSRAFIVKFDNNGEIIWKKVYKHPGQEETAHRHNIKNLVELDNGDLVTLGTTGLIGAIAKPWLMKLNSEGCLSETNCGRPLTLATNETIVTAPSDLFFPNPSKGIFTINEAYYSDIKEMKVFNLEGAIIYEYQDDVPAMLDLTAYPTGIYTVQISDKDGVLSIAKVLKQ